MNRAEIITTSAVTTITEGHVLHVHADRLPGSRKAHTYAREAVDLTVGPDARGAFLVVDYSHRPGGVEERHATAAEAIRDVSRRLGGERMIAGLGIALVKVHGPAPKSDFSRTIREAQERSDGERMHAFADSRPVDRKSVV